MIDSQVRAEAAGGDAASAASRQPQSNDTQQRIHPRCHSRRAVRPLCTDFSARGSGSAQTTCRAEILGSNGLEAIESRYLAPSGLLNMASRLRPDVVQSAHRGHFFYPSHSGRRLGWSGLPGYLSKSESRDVLVSLRKRGWARRDADGSWHIMKGDQRVCLLCSEGGPGICHRHHLIARVLLGRGWTPSTSCRMEPFSSPPAPPGAAPAPGRRRCSDQRRADAAGAEPLGLGRGGVASRRLRLDDPRPMP